jgi:mycofactocin precursor
MSERMATAGVLDSTETLDSTGATGLEPEEPDLATADLLVEEVSIDGMCGVY